MSWCGMLNIDKPHGITSRYVVDQVEKLVKPAKVGHAGTLDPLATGVLVVCVGTATRLISYVQEGTKRYRGRFRLGQISSTDDSDGEVLEEKDWSHVTQASLENLLPEFTGTIMQTPPQVSAVKVDGHRAYKLARRGAVVDIKPRPVDVYSLKLESFEPPEFELVIECSSGTYIRSIGRDIGQKLGCGALMTSLRRERVADFDVTQSTKLSELKKATLKETIHPPIEAINHLPKRLISPAEAAFVRQGRPIPFGRFSPGDNPPSGEVVLVDEHLNLIGIARADLSTSLLHPKLIVPVN